MRNRQAIGKCWWCTGRAPRMERTRSTAHRPAIASTASLLLLGIARQHRHSQRSTAWPPRTHIHRQLAALVGVGGVGAEARLQVVAQVGVAWEGVDDAEQQG